MTPEFVHVVMRVELKAGFDYCDSKCVGEARAVALFKSSRGRRHLKREFLIAPPGERRRTRYVADASPVRVQA
jgi:hypothetical protein